MARVRGNGFAVVSLMLTLIMCSHAALTPTEGTALLSLKREWQAKYNATTWVAGTDPCASNWSGVQCDQLGNHVISLNLTQMGLVGKVPDAIGNLTFLEVLDVSNWDATKVNFTGPNTVKGDFSPLANLRSLRSLNISWNSIGQGFPSVIYSLTNMTELMVDNCNITGPLTPEIANLQKLQRFYAGSNDMTGGLPKELGSLSNLRELTLWGSAWNSELPAEIGNLTNLEYLNLHNSGLWGGLPSTFGALKKLQRLWLYSNDFTGRIPITWQNMTSLTNLRLSENYISGIIPTWIWTSRNLTALQLQSNQFTGPYPANLAHLFENIQLQCNFLNGTDPTIPAYFANITKPPWDVDDNCFAKKQRRKTNSCKPLPTLCDVFFGSLTNGGCPPCPEGQEFSNSTLCTCKLKGKKLNVVPIIASVVGVTLGILILVGVALFIFWKRKKDQAKFAHGRFDPALARELNDPNWKAPPGVQRFRLSELSAATGGFDRAHEIGVGGFGKVFIGNFKDGRTLAIKRASGLVSSNQGLAEFRNEVLLLSRLHHRNLVRLEGFCDESGLQILVYEYMRQGNLHAHVFRPKGSRKCLNWYNRLDIAVGIAQGLEYLHSFADPPVIHRDVKPSNILLDDHLTAKVADFGISRATEDLATHISTRPAGTAGYFDPQYFLRQQLTTASDVYGYGVVLLELVTGQKAIDHERVDEFNLVEWARPRLRAGGIQAIVDPALGDSYPKQIYKDMADLALECSVFNKDDRPSMKAVLSILEPHLQTSQPPEQTFSELNSSPWGSTDSGLPTEASSSTNVTTHSQASGVTSVELTSTLLPR